VLVTFNYTMAHDNGILGTIERAAKSGIGVIAMKTQPAAVFARILTCRNRSRR